VKNIIEADSTVFGAFHNDMLMAFTSIGNQLFGSQKDIYNFQVFIYLTRES